MQFLPLTLSGMDIYVGFWRRLGALLIDMLVALPFFALWYFLSRSFISSSSWFIGADILDTLLLIFYLVFFHYRFGATLGKMAVGIKVTKPDGSAITLKQALLRAIVDIFCGIIAIILSIYVFTIIDATQFAALPETVFGRSDYIDSLAPTFELFEVILVLWGCSELIVLLFNKRKRALHDFIAGTVVIKKEFAKNT